MQHHQKYASTRFIKTAQLCVLIVLFVALVVLSGWVFHIAILKSFNADWATTKVNTAIGLLLSGICFLVNQRQSNSPGAIFFNRFVCVILFLLGAISIVEYAVHDNFGIDELIFRDDASLNKPPGRMSPATALAFIFLAISLYLYPYKKQAATKVSEGAVLVVLLIGFTSIIGYIFNASKLYTITGFTSLAFPTSLCLLCISAAIILSKPEGGLISVFAQKTYAAFSGFKVLLLSLFLLLFLGWLRLKGQEMGLFDTQFGASLLILSFAILFSCLLWHSTNKLNYLEYKRNQLLNEVEKSNEEIKSIFNRVSDAFMALDAGFNFTYANSKAYEIMQRPPQSLMRKNIWEEFPVALHTAFYNAILLALQTQEFAHLEEFYPQGNIWIEFFIYPSENGLSIYFINITERKNAEKALKESEEKFRTVVENASDAIFIADKNGKYIEVNSQAVGLTGFSKEELLNRTIFDMVVLDKGEQSINLGAINEGTVIRTRKLKKKGNTFIPVEISATRLPDGRLLGLVRDITERLQAEEQIMKTNERFQLISKATNDAVLDWDLEKNTMWGNEAAYKLFALQPGKDHFSYKEWVARLHPDDQERDAQSFETALYGGKESWQQEFRFLMPDGSYGVAFGRAYMIKNSEGVPIRVVGSIIDLSDNKKVEQALMQSEEEYRLLFNATPLPAWVIDNKTQNYLRVNEAAVQHYGYSREEFLRMSVKDLQPESELDKYIQRISTHSKSFTGNQGVWKHRKKDGNIIDVEIISHDIIYQNKPARLALANDITQKLRLEKEMRQVNEELRNLSAHLQNIREEERMHIAREIHDELGQQLTGLKMDVYWLNKRIKTEEPVIQDKIAGILGQIDDTVLSVRKIASNLRPGILDDLGLVAAMEWQSQEVEKRSEIKIHFVSALPEVKIPEHIKTAIFRIYQEALTNAVRHANAHHIYSRLKLHHHNICLEVKDDGKGMDVNSTQKNTFGLLGIKERTYEMNGTFEITSQPEKGTTIYISVPLLNK